MKFLQFKNCPVCGSSSFKICKDGYANMYSEQISKYLKIKENNLIDYLKNLKCTKCGVIFKKYWFNKKTLIKIFNEIIPIHPKGWDTISNKFSIKYFKKLLIKFKRLLERGGEKKLELNKVSRELISIADSVSVSKVNEKKSKNRLINSIKFKNLKQLEINLEYLKNKFKNPEDFKRFKGFNSKNLEKYIESKIGRIETYGEIGCPLWGGLQHFSNKKHCKFIKGLPFQFWGAKCRSNSNLCHNKLKSCVKKYNQLPRLKNKIDYMAIYLYLDHVINPIKFLKNTLKISNSIGLILESSKDGVPVQHFTGWNKEAIQFIAKKFNKKLDKSFSPIKKTGKDFFLIH